MGSQLVTVVAPEYVGLQFESGGRHSRLECRPIGCTACFGAGRCRPARCTPGLGAGRCLRHRCTPGPVPASACGTGALQVSVPAAPFALQVSVQASACGTGALRAPVPTFFATLQHLAPVQVALCAAWVVTALVIDVFSCGSVRCISSSPPRFPCALFCDLPIRKRCYQNVALFTLRVSPERRKMFSSN